MEDDPYKSVTEQPALEQYARRFRADLEAQDARTAALEREVRELRGVVAGVQTQSLLLEDEIDRINGILATIGHDSRIAVDYPDGEHIRIRYVAPYSDAFAIEIKGQTARISPGRLVMPLVSVGSWESAQTDVTISGASPAWVYAVHARGHTGGLAIATSTTSTYPISNGSEYRFALWELRGNGTIWVPWRPCFGGTDILFGGI